MSVYLQATIEVRMTGMASFCAAMEKTVEIMKEAGWTLRGGYVHQTGRLNTVIDIWELPDANALEDGYRMLLEHQDFPEAGKLLEDAVVSETLVLLSAAPYFSAA